VCADFRPWVVLCGMCYMLYPSVCMQHQVIHSSGCVSGREDTVEVPVTTLLQTYERVSSSLAAREQSLEQSLEETKVKVAARRAFADAAEDLNAYIQVMVDNHGF
jgi:hypothetical protein